VNDAQALSVESLGFDDLHVWLCVLSRYDAQAEHFCAMLSADEAARHRRFVFPRDRRRFLLSHGLLRVILGAYAGREPRELKFSVAPQGKPFLLDPTGAPDALRFSLSHSGDYAAIAVAGYREVGVDIEAAREDMNELELAQRFFAPAEAKQVVQAEAESRRRVFYRYWTAKEAFLKGRGTGLSEGLRRFAVQWDTDLLGHVTPADGSLLSTQWRIRALELDEGLAGAVAFDGADCRLRVYESSSLVPV